MAEVRVGTQGEMQPGADFSFTLIGFRGQLNFICIHSAAWHGKERGWGGL